MKKISSTNWIMVQQQLKARCSLQANLAALISIIIIITHIIMATTLKLIWLPILMTACQVWVLTSTPPTTA